MTIRVTTRGAGAWVLLVVMGGCATPTPVPIDDARVREEPTALPDAAGIDAPEAPADATADVPMDVAVDVPADTTSPSDSMDAEAAVPDAETAVPDAETAVPDADAAVPDAETAVPDLVVHATARSPERAVIFAALADADGRVEAMTRLTE